MNSSSVRSKDHCDKNPTRLQLGICPFTLALFGASTLYITYQQRQRRNLQANSNSRLPSCQVVFVLGAPGSGKGTQCALWTQRQSGWAHLSAGDLLRAERQDPHSQLGALINERIASGQLVPSEITCQLLEKGMQQLHQREGITKFLIDGFPRSFGNQEAWDATMSQHKVLFCLFFDCPEDVLVGRLLQRGETSGRNDDNLEVIRKRFHTYEKENLPIVDFYKQKGLLRTIGSDKSKEAVYKEVARLLEGL